LYLSSPIPLTTRSQTCAYVTRVAVNVPGVTSMGHEVHEGHTKKRALRHKYVKKIKTFPDRTFYVEIFMDEPFIKPSLRRRKKDISIGVNKMKQNYFTLS
jgi:hypothetical protein